MSNIIHASQTENKERGPMKITSYHINEEASGTYIELDGEHGAITCVGAERICFIIEGTGVFIIDDKKENVGPGDLVHIMKGTTYNLIGKMKYFLLNRPAFNSDQDIVLDT